MHDDLTKQQRPLISSTFHQKKANPLDSLWWDMVEAVEVDGSGV
jgi:hypothetical protein